MLSERIFEDLLGRLDSRLGDIINNSPHSIRDILRPRRYPEGADATTQEVLLVQDVDFCIEANGENHHTSKFDLMRRKKKKCLVIRRGQPFKLELLLNRPYDANRDAISFIFYVEDVNNFGPSRAASVAVPLLKKSSDTIGNWNAVYDSQADSRLTIIVTPAADCIVAIWKFDIDTKLFEGRSLSYTHPLPIYVLFNPWCTNDSVYLSDESHKYEYVLEDAGLLFQGISDFPTPFPWYYGQYEADILNCAMYLVRKVGEVKGKARSDPIRTARGLSAAVNSNDDRGVLVGNWGPNLSDYANGKHPLKWVGSLSILQNYYETKKPVKYAQCWVYAGVLTTVCRALGIPCRPVTCFNAAHDSEGSLTIDTFYDDEGNAKDDASNDLIWNYHVWNEVWMDRPDLGAEYNGWQVLDATPQEPSDAIFRCGPTSLKAVREGELQRSYDVAYVFAQVNADKVIWKYSGIYEPLKLMSTDTTIVGQNICTKAIGKMKPEFITNTYKYPEKTRAERMTMEKALKASEHIYARYYLNEVFNDIVFEFELKDDVKIGQDFDVVLHIKNHSPTNEHQVQGVLCVDTVTYNGVTRDRLKKYRFDIKVAPEAKESIKMLVKFKDYYTKLSDQGSFNITCKAVVVENQHDSLTHAKFRVCKPDIKISVDGKPVLNQELNVTLTVENPLRIPLRKGKFYIQGAGLNKQLKIALDEDVAPGAYATANFKLTPQWAGRFQITAKFNSKELRDVNGFLSFDIEQPNFY